MSVYLVCQSINQVHTDSLLEITEMGMLRWMMGIKTIEKIRGGEGVVNISENIREGKQYMIK